VYLLEGFLRSPYSQICEISRNFEKIWNKLGNNPVSKKVNTPKVNTRVNTFLRKYPVCLKVNTFFSFGIRFLLEPYGVDELVMQYDSQYGTIRYDTIGEFNVDSKAEYSALSSTRSYKNI